jgi:hypothetical protein
LAGELRRLGVPFEIIGVNDGSSDNSLNMLKAAAGSHQSCASSISAGAARRPPPDLPAEPVLDRLLSRSLGKNLLLLATKPVVVPQH